ncbi:hypothetical protein CBR_g40166 [Chara braunii]|uniref:Uncharacterized protein n=1 Tax=Chara braunii TaxID=69332 RepID=A0A388LT71_CHABU|nr:hypothetical protein CBR_g40166 [Chara braunii]|eukprot:GBG85528.1 hypothetical protein CBR_g40166 [Chara braunii]
MREYFAEMARERRVRREKEEMKEQNRREEEARTVKERRRLQREEERQQREAERGARLLRIIKGELMKEPEGNRESQVRRGKRVARVNEFGETVEEENERLRRTIAKQEDEGTDVEDEELRVLGLRAAELEIKEKRKRGPDLPIGNSPPMAAPEKRSNVRLSEEAKRDIEEFRTTSNGECGPSGVPRKIDLTIKHISASCRVGGKEKYEADCREFYDALTVEELKEVCRHEKIPYGKHEAAIRRLVIRRSSVAYDLAYNTEFVKT